MKAKLFLGLLILGLTGQVRPAFAADALDPAVQAKVDAQLKVVQAWAAEPVVVNAVKAQNASLPPDSAAMTQDKWKDLSKLDPFVRSFDKNDAAIFLKSKKSDAVIRAFLSDAAGLKVAFTAKTLSWSHKGDPKHDLPMTGKTWQGPLEQDKASGLEQVQISVPVLDGDKPIGSLVVGLSVSKL
jgi:hypothetical protein